MLQMTGNITTDLDGSPGLQEAACSEVTEYHGNCKPGNYCGDHRSSLAHFADGETGGGEGYSPSLVDTQS